MPLSSFSTAVTVFLTTWLSGPLIYSLDKLAAMEDERWIFVAGVIVLPCFGLMTYVFARKTQAMAESDQPLFYGKHIVADRKHASTYSPVAFRWVHTGIEPPFLLRNCLGVRYRTPRLRGYGSGTGHRATPMRTVSGSGSL